jgi:hypothetical protein
VNDDSNQQMATIGPNGSADWVSAAATRNFLLKDPLLDWLELHGGAKGFKSDSEQPGYDPRTDFLPFILRQGHLFEEAVLKHIGTSVPIVFVAHGSEDIRSADKARATIEYMRSGEPIIAAGVLWNEAGRTYGSPDLLVRSDVLGRLFLGLLTPEVAAIAAPGLGASPWHYRVVDVKFTTLHLAKSGHAANGHLAYMAQVFLYNEALGRLQAYQPDSSYLLGRGWKQGDDRGRSCMERLAPVRQDHQYGRPSVALESSVREAVEWVRRVRRDGGGWQALPSPSVPGLRPNMKNAKDQPWHAAKAGIARDTQDLTLLWWVGADAREAANAKGIERWRDPRCSAAVLGVTGESRPRLLNAIIAANQREDGAQVLPPRVIADEAEWKSPGPLEFYVDFETVSNLADDFSKIPEVGGQELIFMIGCGHVEEGKWRFRCFIVAALTELAEAAIIDDWFAHMREVREKISPQTQPLVFHWSPAETVTLETGFRSACARHPEKAWPQPRWFDFLNRVIKAEPVVTRGAMGFGLKAVAKPMHAAGLIETLWADGPTDGLGAMVGAWHCSSEASTLGVALGELDLMKDIAGYNEVDCRVMMEIIGYLRRHH